MTAPKSVAAPAPEARPSVLSRVALDQLRGVAGNQIDVLTTGAYTVADSWTPTNVSTSYTPATVFNAAQLTSSGTTNR